jgi:hypothetical protein
MDIANRKTAATDDVDTYEEELAAEESAGREATMHHQHQQPD